MSEAEQDRRIDRLEKRIDGIEVKLDEIKNLIMAMQVSNASRGECPSPGKCVSLESRIVTLEGLVMTLNNAWQQTKGGGKVIAGLWGAFGAALVGGLIWLLQHMGVKP